MNERVFVWFAWLFARSLELLLRHQSRLELAQATNEIAPDSEIEPFGYALYSKRSGPSGAPLQGQNPHPAQPLIGTPEFAERLLNRCNSIIDNPSSPKATTRVRRLASAVRVLSKDPFGLHTVASLANFAGMSRSSFSQCFNEVFGEAPIEFLTRERLRVAEYSLRTTSLPVKAIVSKIGYSSLSYFSRAFRAEYGMAPTQLRKVSASRDSKVRVRDTLSEISAVPQIGQIYDTIAGPPLTAPYEVFESFPGCVKVLDSKANILFSNRQGLFAMEVDSLLHIQRRPWVSLWPKETRPQVQAAVEQALRGEIGTVSGFRPTAKGSPRWWNVVILAISTQTERTYELVVFARDFIDKNAAPF